MEDSPMYELQMRAAGSDWKYEGHRSGSISDLKDYATLQSTGYRIVDATGKVVWSFKA
jgi:hypothetical protein